MSIIKRSVDLEYLNQNFYQKPKQIHTDLLKIIEKEKLLKNNNLKFCDFGCADGQFLNLISKKTNFSITGVDVHSKLLNKAKKNIDDLKIVEGSVLNKNLFRKNSFDLITMTGVLSIFDNFIQPLNNLIKWTRPGGLLIITSVFNDSDIDVFINYRNSSKKKFINKNKSDWNIFSKKSLSFFLKRKKKIKNFEFKDFKLKVDIKKNENFPHKMWTIKKENKENICVNGLSLVLDQKFLIIHI